MNIKEAVETYQCPGCVCGNDFSCYTKDSESLACGSHVAGTIISPYVGIIFLGMPRGFNRLGPYSHFKPWIGIYKNKKEFKFDKFNIPSWKHLDEHGSVLVRVFMPRLNCGYVVIFLENCMNDISCIEITKEDIKDMD